jgi:hypothetical protein
LLKNISSSQRRNRNCCVPTFAKIVTLKSENPKKRSACGFSWRKYWRWILVEKILEEKEDERRITNPEDHGCVVRVPGGLEQTRERGSRIDQTHA